jgi:aminomethyltransferase
MKHTALYDRHKSLGAKLMEFHGWEMPLEYSGVVKEHEAVRKSAGIFDIGHMGAIEIGGADSLAFMRKVLTFRPETLPVDSARYAFLLNPQGGIKDDLMVYRLNEERFLLCVNASNKEGDLSWLRENEAGFDAVLIDDSPDTAILALQGPASWDIARKALDIDPAGFKYHAFINSKYAGTGYILSKTGYTGEKGFEIFIHNKAAVKIWDGIMEAGREHGLVPCGLGARDTLRLEMGFILHGSDADEDTNPVEAGYDFAIDFGNEEFIGREALLKVKAEGAKRRLTGLVLKDKGVPRHGCRVLAGGTEVGVVTSGNFSPMLKKGVALAYLRAGAPTEGLSIDIHGKPHEALVAALPFYRKN